MKHRALSASRLIVLASVTAFPCISLGEVQINLKNETSIRADECREENDRLVCFKMGGSFELEKRDVLSVQNRSGRLAPVPDADRSAAEITTEADSHAKAADRTDGAALPAGTGPASADPATSSDTLAQKRLSLQAERESLLRERQKIRDDIKNAPDWMPANQYNELSRRNTELDTRIRRFNEEAGKLSEQGRKPAAEVNK